MILFYENDEVAIPNGGRRRTLVYAGFWCSVSITLGLGAVWLFALVLNHIEPDVVADTDMTHDMEGDVGSGSGSGPTA